MVCLRVARSRCAHILTQPLSRSRKRTCLHRLSVPFPISQRSRKPAPQLLRPQVSRRLYTSACVNCVTVEFPLICLARAARHNSPLASVQDLSDAELEELRARHHRIAARRPSHRAVRASGVRSTGPWPCVPCSQRLPVFSNRRIAFVAPCSRSPLACAQS